MTDSNVDRRYLDALKRVTSGRTTRRHGFLLGKRLYARLLVTLLRAGTFKL